MSIKFLVFFGGGILGFWGGECRFYFYGRADFSEIRNSSPISSETSEDLRKPLRTFGGSQLLSVVL